LNKKKCLIFTTKISSEANGMVKLNFPINMENIKGTNSFTLHRKLKYVQKTCDFFPHKKIIGVGKL